MGTLPQESHVVESKNRSFIVSRVAEKTVLESKISEDDVDEHLWDNYISPENTQRSLPSSSTTTVHSQHNNSDTFDGSSFSDSEKSVKASTKVKMDISDLNEKLNQLTQRSMSGMQNMTLPEGTATSAAPTPVSENQKSLGETQGKQMLADMPQKSSSQSQQIPAQQVSSQSLISGVPQSATQSLSSQTQTTTSQSATQSLQQQQQQSSQPQQQQQPKQQAQQQSIASQQSLAQTLPSQPQQQQLPTQQQQQPQNVVPQQSQQGDSIMPQIPAQTGYNMPYPNQAYPPSSYGSQETGSSGSQAGPGMSGIQTQQQQTQQQPQQQQQQQQQQPQQQQSMFMQPQPQYPGMMMPPPPGMYGPDAMMQMQMQNFYSQQMMQYAWFQQMQQQQGAGQQPPNPQMMNPFGPQMMMPGMYMPPFFGQVPGLQQQPQLPGQSQSSQMPNSAVQHVSSLSDTSSVVGSHPPSPVSMRKKFDQLEPDLSSPLPKKRDNSIKNLEEELLKLRGRDRDRKDKHGGSVMPADSNTSLVLGQGIESFNRDDEQYDWSHDGKSDTQESSDELGQSAEKSNMHTQKKSRFSVSAVKDDPMNREKETHLEPTDAVKDTLEQIVSDIELNDKEKQEIENVNAPKRNRFQVSRVSEDKNIIDFQASQVTGDGESTANDIANLPSSSTLNAFAVSNSKSSLKFLGRAVTVGDTYPPHSIALFTKQNTHKLLRRRFKSTGSIDVGLGPCPECGKDDHKHGSSVPPSSHSKHDEPSVSPSLQLHDDSEQVRFQIGSTEDVFDTDNVAQSKILSDLRTIDCAIQTSPGLTRENTTILIEVYKLYPHINHCIHTHISLWHILV